MLQPKNCHNFPAGADGISSLAITDADHPLYSSFVSIVIALLFDESLNTPPPASNVIVTGYAA